MRVLEGYTLTQVLPLGEEFLLRRGHRNHDWQPVLVLAPLQVPASAASLERLKHEYSLRGELDPEWAAQALDFDQSDGTCVLVLADPSGTFLDGLLGQAMETPLFLRLAIGICGALSRMHENEIIHKDINPSQILVDPETGAARLFGFGIASRILREKQALVPLDVIVGSFPYMAPEQTGRMNRSIDSRSDLYALGVTFYQMLTGVLPFNGADPMEWVHCHIARQAVPPIERVPGIAPQLSALVMKLLAKTAEARYQTASGVQADLRQCLETLKGGIDSFVLASMDFSGRLSIPEKLYGREPQRDILLGAVQRVLVGGKPELILISGYSGIGKTSLVNELHQAITHPNTLFAKGKFDQYKRDIPYATLAQVLQTLIRQILSQSEEQLDFWRQSFLRAVGANGQLIVDLIPELKFVIGPQATPVALGPAEAQNRFQMIFRQFLAAFTNADHALILFLDDLQWIDAASLTLLEHIVTHSGLRNFLLIGAYRDNEVGPAHPLMLTAEAIKKSTAEVHEIILKPLSISNVGGMIADTLHCDESGSAPLIELVFNKTAGNPFFTIQFLNRLADERLLKFDHNQMLWVWDLPGIQRKGFSDNVVDLMIYRLQGLPSATLSALKYFACLGNHAKIGLIAVVCDSSEDAIHRQFWHAVRLGLLVRLGDDYQFGHDRVQEAAYSLLDKSLQLALHLKIARMLLAEMEKTGRDDDLFSIVNHYNHGKDLLADAAEQQGLCDLNIRAGNKAKAAIAYASARQYLQQAALLASADGWSRNYQQTFDLYLGLSECEYLTGDFAAAERSFKLTLEHANCILDRAKVAISCCAFCLASGDYPRALAVLLEAVKRLGVEFPDSSDEILTALENEKMTFTLQMNGRSTCDLIDLPEAHDPEICMVLEILSYVVTPCYFVRPELLPLLMLLGVNISLRHGNSAASSMAYCGYALRLAAQGEAALAYEFSELALCLNQKFCDGKRKGQLLYNHGCLVLPWCKSIASCAPILEQSFLASQEAGDIVCLSFCSFSIPYNYFESNAPLEQVQKVARKYITTAQQNNNQLLVLGMRLLEQAANCMMGLTAEEGSMNDDTFSEVETRALFNSASFTGGVVAFDILKQKVATTFGDYAQARISANNAALNISFVKANLYEVNHYFFHALTLAALYPQAASEAERQEAMQTLAYQAGKLKFWADNCPENFYNLYALVMAELARIEGRVLDAMGWYDEAIGSAGENGFLHYEGIANELAAMHCLALGRKTIAFAYLQSARLCYQKWGAMGKVRQLDRRFPELDSQQDNRRGQPGTRVAHLDLLSVIKASHTALGDIELDHLIKQLLILVVEHAGASRGLLLLPDEGEMRIAVRASVDGKQIHVAIKPAMAANALPMTIIDYVLGAKEKVVLDDASIHNPYSEDSYLQGKLHKSVLCMPLVKQAKLVGIVYLENSLATGVFTSERIAIIELLASQAAISLENAILFNNLEREQSTTRELNASLEQRVVERTVELQRAVREQQMTLAQLIQQEKMASLGTLTAGIAHEINNPANFAHVGAQALALDLERFRRFLLDLAEGSDEAVLSSLNRHIDGLVYQLEAIKEGTTRIKNLVLDLRTFSRLDEADWKAVAIADSLRATINLVRTRYQTVAEMRCQLQANPVVECWPAQLNQVFMNLIVNACQAIAARKKNMEISGLLQVRSHVDDASLVLEFEDNGCGMSQATLAHVFDPFFTTKTVGEGMGMGLSIAFGIIEKHRGEISVVSKEGEGSCFTLKLPLRA